jgi:hypothetical protein
LTLERGQGYAARLLKGAITVTNIIKLAACLAWAGLAVSSATPVDAMVTTRAGFGLYASCSASYSTYADTGLFCDDAVWSYTQNIKFVSSACSTGGCSETTGSVYVESVYPAGRKPVISLGGCSNSMVYELFDFDTCNC